MLLLDRYIDIVDIIDIIVDNIVDNYLDGGHAEVRVSAGVVRTLRVALQTIVNLHNNIT